MNEDMGQQTLNETQRNPAVHSNKNTGWCRTIVKSSKTVMNWPALPIADLQGTMAMCSQLIIPSS